MGCNIVSLDALLSYACLEADAQELRELPPRVEIEAKYSPSEKFKNNVEQEIKRFQSKIKRKNGVKYLCRSCITIATTLGVLAACFLPAEAVRESVVSTALIWRDEFVSFVFNNEAEAEVEPIPEMIEFQYLPEGYEIEGAVVHSLNIYKTTFYNENDGRISFSLQRISEDISWVIDSETTNYYQIQFMGIDAIWGVDENNTNILLWSDNSYTYLILSEKSLNELIKIAEGVAFQ